MVNSIFSIEGSLVSHQGDVPNFSRPSPVNLERVVDGAVQLYPVRSHYPAIYSEDGCILLEPPTVNLVSYNLDLSNAVWIKGSNVRNGLRVDYAPAPDTSYLADRLTWTSATGAANLMQREFKLDAGTQYTLSALLRLVGGLFGGNDEIRVVGDVVGTVKIPLTELNNSVNRYKLLQTTFTTAGRQPVLPGNEHSVFELNITNVTASTLNITIPAGFNVAADSLVGGRVEIASTQYLITANTALNAGSITVTVASSSLVSNGVTTSSKAVLNGPPEQTVTLEVYSESTAAIDWGGLQLEEHPFRTSMVYQDENIESRSGVLVEFQKSPIAERKTFGFYGELREWRGDGNLFDFGNLRGEIVEGKLRVTADSTVLDLAENLPPSNLKIFIQVLEANSSLSVYVNGVLRARTTLSNFRGDAEARFRLTSRGVRVWRRMLVPDTALLEGQINVGEEARQEVADLFNTRVLIDPVQISAHAPLINLPPVTVPGMPDPIAQSTILNVNFGTGAVGVESATGFVIGTQVIIKRGKYTILRTTINTISGNTITLASNFNAAIGDVLVFGEPMQPGRASIRLPYIPVDPQNILAINVGLNRITVDSALSFTREKAFIRNILYQDIAEVLILDTDNSNNFLFLNSVAGLAVGQTIAQPKTETLAYPDGYFAGILDPVDGVNIAEKYINGLVLENWNKYPVTVAPYVRVYL